MIPVEISLRSPTHALHKTLPLHHHTISSSSTRLQRCIFSRKRMGVSTAYAQLYHPGKSWREELSNLSVLSSMLPQFCDQFSRQTPKNQVRDLCRLLLPSALAPLVALPGTEVWASTLNSQPSSTPAPRSFLGMPAGISASSPSHWAINWDSSELSTHITTGNSSRRRGSLCPAAGEGGTGAACPAVSPLGYHRHFVAAANSAKTTNKPVMTEEISNRGWPCCSRIGSGLGRSRLNFNIHLKFSL